MGHPQDKMTSGPERRLVFGLQEIWREGQQLPELGKTGLLRQMGRQSWANLKLSVFSSIVTVATVSLSIALIGAMLLLLLQLSSALSGVEREFIISAYLKEGLSSQQLETLNEKVRTLEGIESTTYWSKSEALENFKQAIGDQNDLIDGLETENPLPASFEIELKPGFANSAGIDAVTKSLTETGMFEQVSHSSEFVERVWGFVGFIRNLSYVSMALVLVILTFIMMSTVKLALYARREEISVMRLVGGTSNWIAGPYIIEGGLVGLVGALLALGFLAIGVAAVNDLLSGTEAAEMLLNLPIELPWYFGLGLVFSGLLVGVLGSYLAVRPFVNE